MGLTIHYNGSLKDPNSLSELIGEIKDIAETHKWEYSVFETEFPADSFGAETYDRKLYGICFSPPKCEMVAICFLSNGKMSGPVQIQLYSKTEDRPEDEGLYMLATKTQFAGADIHKMVVGVLKFVEKKYLARLEVSDEGHFWETGDEKLLDERFEEYTFLIDSFASSLEMIPKKEGESIEDHMIRLMEFVQKRRPKKG